jgi:hypothetical protein
MVHLGVDMAAWHIVLLVVLMMSIMASAILCHAHSTKAARATIIAILVPTFVAVQVVAVAGAEATVEVRTVTHRGWSRGAERRI